MSNVNSSGLAYSFSLLLQYQLLIFFLQLCAAAAGLTTFPDGSQKSRLRAVTANLYNLLTNSTD
jgi:hypothetical protein